MGATVIVRRSLVIASMLLALAALAFVGWQALERPGRWFVEHPLPVAKTHRLYDIGVVDANGDGVLDIYTSNHHFRQLLLIGDGHGGYRDALSEYGLDQSRDFPQAELSFIGPHIERPGVYVYWLGTQLIVRSHQIDEIGPWQGSLRVNSGVEVVVNEGFEVEQTQQPGAITETVIAFASTTDGKLVLRPSGQGLPISFELNGSILPAQIYVGRGGVSPRASSFVLAMRDRHAMAWADYNGNGLPDIFINRGALGGTLRAHSDAMQQALNDELLVRPADGKRYVDVAAAVGIQKRGCSGRKAQWVDFDRSGRLDLFVNCQDRGNIDGLYPKQLYRQDAERNFEDVATAVGLGLAEHELIDFVWFDANNDGEQDLLTSEGTGFYLHRNEGGTFSREFIGRGRFAREDDASLKGTTDLPWFVDGKLSVADFDGDGYLDVFSASRMGNMLLVNRGGRFSLVEPATLGLPEASLAASWVDFDNDQRPDLHAVPQGLFRQRADRTFTRTGLLAQSSSGQYRAAIVNWFDLDNDGRLDALIALSIEPDFKRWWERQPPRRPRDEWKLIAFRNVGDAGHWLQVALVGPPGNRDGIGARVSVATADGEQTHEIGRADGSFFSQGHYRLYFGLGPHARADAVRIRWPDGHEQELRDVAGDRLLTVEREEAGQDTQ